MTVKELRERLEELEKAGYSDNKVAFDGYIHGTYGHVEEYQYEVDCVDYSETDDEVMLYMI